MDHNRERDALLSEGVKEEAIYQDHASTQPVVEDKKLTDLVKQNTLEIASQMTARMIFDPNKFLMNSF